MTIKISAFPAASLPMGLTDVVTGLQGGANVNFTQAQILRAQDGPSGNVLFIYGGTGSTGDGGSIFNYAGYALGSSGDGGGVFLRAGYAYGSGNGGHAGLYAGACYGTGGGGKLTLSAGDSDKNAPVGGGNAYINGGYGPSGGYIYLNAGDGHLRGGGSIILKLGTGVSNNGYLEIKNIVSSPGSQAGTLTNSPVAGNPNDWIQVLVNGFSRHIPAW